MDERTDRARTLCLAESSLRMASCGPIRVGFAWVRGFLDGAGWLDECLRFLEALSADMAGFGGECSFDVVGRCGDDYLLELLMEKNVGLELVVLHWYLS